MAKHFHRRIAAPGWTLGTWSCTCDHRGPGEEQHTLVPTLNVPIGGLYARHAGRRPPVLVDPTVASFSLPGEVWRTSHPAGSGDRGVYVQMTEATLDALRGRALPSIVRLDPPTWWRWRAVLRAEGPGLEEEARALVADLVGEPLPDAEPPVVRKARAVLVARRREPPSLAELADEVGASPWHLCRVFRRATGLGPHAFSEQVRLRAAADAVASGPVDLAEVALQHGFSSHSHLTDRFRRAFGFPPSAARARS